MSTDSPGPSVLFVCVRNGGKSQMAAALMRMHAGDRVKVHSAGTRPGAAVNALSAEAVAELGADMTGETPTALDPDLAQRVDRVVVLGDEAAAEMDDDEVGSIDVWQTDEPSHRGIDGLERMRLVRDDIDRRVLDLLTELLEPEQDPACTHTSGLDVHVLQRAAGVRQRVAQKRGWAVT